MSRAKVFNTSMGPTRAISTQIPTDAYASFGKLAELHDMTKSELMRTLVLDALYKSAYPETDTEQPCAAPINVR